jgi:hypothetical protein
VTCKHCGTEIADNALICFRCGQSTATPSSSPGRARPTGGRISWVSTMAALVLVVAALFMGRSTYVGVPRELPWAMGALGVVLVGWLLWKRGRR